MSTVGARRACAGISPSAACAAHSSGSSASCARRCGATGSDARRWYHRRMERLVNGTAASTRRRRRWPSSCARSASKASASRSSATARSCPRAATGRRASPPATGSRSSPPSAGLICRQRARRKIARMKPCTTPRRRSPIRWSSPAAPTAPGCWSAPASTATSRRRARRSSPPARRSSRWRSAAPTSARTRTRRRCSTPCRPSEFTYLPNSAGCYTADDAVRTLRLARELLDGHALTKLEVLGDANTLFPNVRETLKAAEQLVADGFQVMVYTSDDPIIARELEQIGCVAIMPLASLIGSGMGILNPWNLRLIIEQSKVPVLVDAGVGTASDAAIAMELGCAGVLMNTAIALAQDPVRMARAMRSRSRPGARRSWPGACRASCTRRAPARPPPASFPERMRAPHACLRRAPRWLAARRARRKRRAADARARDASSAQRRGPRALRAHDRGASSSSRCPISPCATATRCTVTLFPSGTRRARRHRIARQQREELRAVGLLEPDQRRGAVRHVGRRRELRSPAARDRAAHARCRPSPCSRPTASGSPSPTSARAAAPTNSRVWRVARDGVRKEIAYRPPAPLGRRDRARGRTPTRSSLRVHGRPAAASRGHAGSCRLPTPAGALVTDVQRRDIGRGGPGDATPLRPVRSFVLRQGRMSPAQSRALDRAAGRVRPRRSRRSRSTSERSFGRRAAVRAGDRLRHGRDDRGHRGRRSRERDFIGVEVHAPGRGRAPDAARRAGAANVRVIRHDAVEVVARHDRRRLAGRRPRVLSRSVAQEAAPQAAPAASPRSCARSRRALAPGGYLHVATDWEDYAQRNARHARGRAAAREHRARTSRRGRRRGPHTKFEARGQQLGHGVFDLVFSRR